MLQEPVAGRVEGIQAVDDLTAEAHLLARLRGRVERIVVSIQPIQQGRLPGGLVLERYIWCLALWRGEVLGGGTLGPSPVALADEEGAPDGAGIDFARAGVDQVLLGLEDGAGAALVIDAKDLCADLELAALRGDGQGLQELDQALAVDDAGVVKVRNAGDLDGLLGSVEIDDFLGGVLECWSYFSGGQPRGRLRLRWASVHLRSITG